MLRVGYDEQIFAVQVWGGISRYFASIISRFRQDNRYGVDPELGWKYTTNRHAKHYGVGKEVPHAYRFSLRTRRRVYKRLNALSKRRIMNTTILHGTYYMGEYLRRRSPPLRVTTVHDMIPELFPNWFINNPHAEKREYVQRSNLIICVSESTKRDLLRIYDNISSPVVVIPLGVDREFFKSRNLESSTRDSYVLFVGDRRYYKDFDLLLEAYADTTTRFRSIIAAGGGSFSIAEKEIIGRLGLSENVAQVAPTESELRDLYRSAGAFVFPSRYEGFGLTTLEAMASGCPTVLADVPVHREVGGSAALYFASGDAGALGRVLERLSDDAVLRERLRMRGIERARRFSWETTAERTADAYTSMLD